MSNEEVTARRFNLLDFTRPIARFVSSRFGQKYTLLGRQRDHIASLSNHFPHCMLKIPTDLQYCNFLGDSDFQRKLHGEVSAVASKAPTYDEFNLLPLLDAVIQETLRTYSITPAILLCSHRRLSAPGVD